jgi:hypothetical protein
MRVFRSRGIRLSINRQTREWEIREKIYYDADAYEKSKENNGMLKLLENKIIKRFEYSIREGDKVDTINFHVDLTKEISQLYFGLDKNILQLIENIPKVFNSTFLNYTIGYMFDNYVINQKTFYFYPTIWKGDRYGIKGIEDRDEIKCCLERFIRFIKCGSFDNTIVNYYARNIEKLKGISISADKKDRMTIKLYARIRRHSVLSIMDMLTKENNVIRFNYDEIRNEYGDPHLVALRIHNTSVSGINLYYLL